MRRSVVADCVPVHCVQTVTYQSTFLSGVPVEEVAISDSISRFNDHDKTTHARSNLITITTAAASFANFQDLRSEVGCGAADCFRGRQTGCQV